MKTAEGLEFRIYDGFERLVLFHHGWCTRLSDTHASHLSRKWYRPRSADHRLEYLVGSHGRTRLMDCAHAIRDSLHRRRPSLFRNRYVVELNGNPVRGSQQLPSIFIIAAIINNNNIIIIIIISINF